jgi:glycosyltransferase 2 family protein
VRSKQLWVGIAVSAILLWVVLRGVRLDDVMHQLRHMHWGWLVPLLASIFVRFWLTAVRWRLFLQPVKRVGVHRLFGITMIGFAANNVLPARLGEFVRAYALGRVEALPASLSFATIVIERLFDGFTLLLFLAGSLAFLNPAPWLVWSAVATGGLYVAVLGVLFALRAGHGLGLLLGLLDRLPARVAVPARRLLDSFRLGLEVLGDARTLGLAALLSILIWTVNAAGLHATFLAFSLDLPFHASFFTLATIAVALVLPAAPGHVGTLQFGTVAGLTLFGVAPDVALSVSIVYHFANTVPICLTALAYLGALNLTVGELRAASEKRA